MEFASLKGSATASSSESGINLLFGGFGYASDRNRINDNYDEWRSRSSQKHRRSFAAINISFQGTPANLTNLFSTIQKHGSHISVIFWGLWLFPLGALIFKLGSSVSKFIGVMLVVAGIGYVLDSTFLFLYPNMKVPTLSDYTFYGEILLMIWLLVKSKTIGELIEKAI